MFCLRENWGALRVLWVLWGLCAPAVRKQRNYNYNTKRQDLCKPKCCQKLQFNGVDTELLGLFRVVYAAHNEQRPTWSQTCSPSTKTANEREMVERGEEAERLQQ